jgi:hypothetical protein
MYVEGDRRYLFTHPWIIEISRNSNKHNLPLSLNK